PAAVPRLLLLLGELLRHVDPDIAIRPAAIMAGRAVVRAGVVVDANPQQILAGSIESHCGGSLTASRRVGHPLAGLEGDLRAHRRLMLPPGEPGGDGLPLAAVLHPDIDGQRLPDARLEGTMDDPFTA